MKRIVSIILILCGLMSVFGCQKNRNLVSVKATQTKLSVGDTTTVQVCFNKMEGVRSFAIRPEIDEESFVIVSARNLAGGFIEDTSNGIVSSLFIEDEEFKKDVVAEFVIRATSAGKRKPIAFNVSVFGENDVKIEVSQPEIIYINVKDKK